DDEKEGGDDEQEYDEDEYDEETRDEESFDPIPKTPENSDDEGNGEEDLGLNVGREEGHDEEEEEDELYRDVNINQGRSIQTTLEVEDSHVTLTLVNPDGQQQSSSASSQFMTSMLNPTLDVEANFSEFMQTNQFAGVISAIFGIVQRYMDQRMNEAVKVDVQIQSDRLRDEAQKENDEFLKTIDESMQKIIKEQVKEQVKVQVSKILPKIEQTVNEQLEAEVLTRSSHSSKTSYDVAADLSEMELKKILIEKMKGNKSIQLSDEQRNLYKALVEAYESDKIILDTYGETVTLKRRRDDDADKDEEPSAGPDRGSKRRREGKEPGSASASKEKATSSIGKSTQGTKSRQASASEFAIAEEPMQTTFQMEEPSHPKLKVDTLTLELIAGPTYELLKGSCKSLVELEYHLEEVYKATTDQLDWVNPEGQQYPHNLLKPLPLIPNNRGRRVIPFEHFINNDLEYLRGGASSRKYTTSVTKTKAADYGHIKWIENLVPRTMWIEESIGYDKHALWGNKDKKNRLMRIDELHKFGDGTLTDGRTALDDRLKGIRMKSILMDFQVTPTKPGRMTKPYSSHRFIANCFNVGNFKMEVKREIVRHMKSIGHSIEISLSLQEANWAIGRPKAMMSSTLAHLGWPKCSDVRFDGVPVRGVLVGVYEWMMYEFVVNEFVVYEFVVYEFMIYEFVVYEFVVYKFVVYESVVYDSCVASLDFTMVYEFIVYEWVV
nr:hypothetical protein [Tanacetum cinerariifolium]